MLQSLRAILIPESCYDELSKDSKVFSDAIVPGLELVVALRTRRCVVAKRMLDNPWLAQRCVRS